MWLYCYRDVSYCQSSVHKEVLSLSLQMPEHVYCWLQHVFGCVLAFVSSCPRGWLLQGVPWMRPNPWHYAARLQRASSERFPDFRSWGVVCALSMYTPLQARTRPLLLATYNDLLWSVSIQMYFGAYSEIKDRRAVWVDGCRCLCSKGNCTLSQNSEGSLMPVNSFVCIDIRRNMGKNIYDEQRLT